MLINKIKKLFIKTVFLSAFFFLFFLAFFSKSVNACDPGQDCGTCGGNVCSWAAPNAQPSNTCTGLGDTYDCSPCLVCSAPVGGGGGGGSCAVTPYKSACPRSYVLSGGCCVCP